MNETMRNYKYIQVYNLSIIMGGDPYGNCLWENWTYNECCKLVGTLYTIHDSMSIIAGHDALYI